MSALRAAAFAAAAVIVPVVATAQFPDTPAGRQFSVWLKEFDAGNRDSLRAFYARDFPSQAQRADQVAGLARQTGGFDFLKTGESTPTKLTAYVQERDGDNFVTATMTVDSGAPYRITGLTLRVTPRPAEFALKRLSESDLLRALRTKADQDAAAHRFAGAVLVAHEGNPVFTQAWGLADRAKRTPNTLDTRFRLGSMNKMFTATAVLQLVQAGKVKLDAPLATYLPDYPNKELASKVTIHQLLTHTGGTGDIFTPEYEQHRLELKTLADYVALFGSRPLAFEPGSRWEYSNYGMVLLGRVIERVTGMSYYDYVAKYIYAPASMASTASEPEDSVVPSRSVGYTHMDSPDAWTSNTNTLPWRGTSAGGGYSTVRDLLRFATALKAHKLLNAEYTTMLTTGKVDTPMGGKYAYGFEDRATGGLRCVGHSGGAPGMNGDLRICDDGYVVVVLSNLDPPAAQRLSEFVVNRLPAH